MTPEQLDRNFYSFMIAKLVKYLPSIRLCNYFLMFEINLFIFYDSLVLGH